MTLSARQAAFLQMAAERAQADDHGALVAFLHAGDRERAGACIDQALRHCEAWKDCTDFRLNALLRGWHLYGDRIPEELKQRIHDVAVGGRYYGGFRPDYPMFYSSENHHMNWAVAEYLAAQLFPDETFTYDGRTAREHHARARFLIASWIDNRSRWGYCEWNSSSYMGINLQSLLNLADFAQEPDIRQLAADAVTRLLADLAADSAYGGVWGAQARMYEPSLFSAGAQETGGALVLLLGAGDATQFNRWSFGPFAAATTRYQAPDWLCRLANDLTTPMVNRERHRSEEALFYDCRSAFWQPPFELTDEEARQRFDRFSLPEFPIRTERRAEYLVSAVLQPAPGVVSPCKGQAVPWLSSLKGRVQIFASQPSAASHPKARATYWAGTSSAPRCHLADGVLAVLYHGKEGNTADFTHAHFPTAALSEWRREGAWFLGRLDDAFVGVWAPPGARLTDQGDWDGREILAPGRTVGWAAVYGCRERDGDFETFTRRCRSTRVRFAAEQGVLEVQADGREPIEISHKRGVAVGNTPVSCTDWPQMDNPVVHGDWGSCSTVAGETTLDFSAVREIKKEWEVITPRNAPAASGV